MKKQTDAAKIAGQKITNGMLESSDSESDDLNDDLLKKKQKMEDLHSKMVGDPTGR